MFLVLTREFQPSTTIRLCQFYLNTFEHRFRILRSLYAVALRSLDLRVATLHLASFLSR
jgi:hypothetical protein